MSLFGSIINYDIIDKSKAFSVYYGPSAFIVDVVSIELSKAYSISSNGTYSSYTNNFPFNSLKTFQPLSGYYLISNITPWIFSDVNVVTAPATKIVYSKAIITQFLGTAVAALSENPYKSFITKAYGIDSIGESTLGYVSGFPFNSLNFFIPNSSYLIFSRDDLLPYTLYSITPTPTPTTNLINIPYDEAQNYRTPTPTPTLTPTLTQTPNPTNTPTPSQTLTTTPTPSPTQTRTPTQTPTQSVTITQTPTPTPTPTYTTTALLGIRYYYVNNEFYNS